MAEENWKEKYMQFHMLQQQMEKISEHVELLNQQNAELEISKNAVVEVGKTTVDNDLLVPVANGIFAKASLKENQKLIINVGADTTVEKTVAEVKGLLEQQQQELSEKIIEAQSLLQEMQGQLLKIYQAVQAEE